MLKVNVKKVNKCIQYIHSPQSYTDYKNVNVLLVTKTENTQTFFNFFITV